jgi:anthranilate 1,2-dioxygenase large subunit
MSLTGQAERKKAAEFAWPSQGVTRAPYRLFTDPEIYKLE